MGPWVLENTYTDVYNFINGMLAFLPRHEIQITFGMYK